MADKKPVLEVRNLSVALPAGADRVHAVEKVSFTVNPVNDAPTQTVPTAPIATTMTNDGRTNASPASVAPRMRKWT